jgi:hypothetical protein
MDNNILAYTAGVMDGDGSFSIFKRKPGKTGISPLYFPMIQLANKNKDLVDFLIKEFMGRLFTRKAYEKNGSIRLPSHQWFLEKSTMCLPFLEKIIPYLVIKKERAEFLKEFIIKNPKQGRVALSQDLLQEREFSYMKMRSFNDKRVSTDSFSRKSSKISDRTEFWAYLAGLFDTDGSFSVKKEFNDIKMVNPKYSSQILLSMTDIKGINFLIENCPLGSVFTSIAKTCKKGMVYRFGIYNREESIIFLKKIIPFLQSKKNQALKLLEFCNGFSTTIYNKGGIDVHELDFREDCYECIKQLNKHGVYKPSLIDSESQEQADEGQAGSNAMQPDRLSAMA